MERKITDAKIAEQLKKVFEVEPPVGLKERILSRMEEEIRSNPRGKKRGE